MKLPSPNPNAIRKFADGYDLHKIGLRLVRGFTLTVAVLYALAQFAVAVEKGSAFSPDISHVWNRLYATLTPPRTHGLEPFMAAPTAEQRTAALALLAELAKDGNEPGAMTPLQRAVMQRYLLLQFHAAMERERTRDPKSKNGEQALMAALVPAIRKIALTAAEIGKLPDNYAAAVARPGVVTEYDPKNPGPFLPKDLLADDGPWIALDLTPKGGRQGLAAQFHFEFYRGSTSFEVRMRHPEGRVAGEAYLQKLAAMPDPYLEKATPESENLTPNGSKENQHPNPKTPQFPPGTAWALIHRAILVDPTGRPVVSPLVEAVQIRVYRALSAEDVAKSDEYKAETAALDAQQQQAESNSVSRLANHYQTAFEWTMRGTLPLEDRGFHLSTAQDSIFAEGRKDVPLVTVCMQCHGAPGIHSVNTRSGLFFGGKMARPPEFAPAPRARLDGLTEETAQKKEVWTKLRELWEK